MEVTRMLMTVRIQSQERPARPPRRIEEQAEQLANVTYTHPNEDGSVSQEPTRPPWRSEVPKVGRNDPCPCGSGKKYKHCHGGHGGHQVHRRRRRAMTPCTDTCIQESSPLISVVIARKGR
jgi:hypothetical protein